MPERCACGHDEGDHSTNRTCRFCWRRCDPSAPAVSEPPDELAETEGWSSVLRWPNECTEEVSHKGHAEPCDRPAVAVRFDPTNGGVYTVCMQHTRAEMVPLAAVLAARLGVHGPTDQP